MKVNIFSPGFVLFSGEIIALTLPASTGNLQILNDHTALIAILEKGIICAKFDKNESKYIPIEAGVAEVDSNMVSILVDE